MKRTWKYIIRLLLSAVVLVWIVGVNRNWPRFLYGHFMDSSNSMNYNELAIVVSILLLTVGCLFAFYQLIVFALYILSLNRSPDHPINRFIELGLFRTLYSFYYKKYSDTQRFRITVVMCGVFLFLFVSVLTYLRLFDKQEAFFLDINFLRDMHRKPILLKYRDENGYEKYLRDEPVRYFNFMTEDNNTGKYLRDLFKIAKDLKDAGAKAVVADRPTGFFAWDNNMFSKIDSLNTVVWGDLSPSWSMKYYSQKEFTRLDRFNSKVVYSVEDNHSKPMFFMRFETITRWYPVMTVANISQQQMHSDVALWVAKKYFGMPDSVAPIVGDGFVSMGDLRVPVSSSGEAFCDNVLSMYRIFYISASRGVGGGEGFDYHPDHLRYNVQVEVSKNQFTTSPKDTVKNLKQFRDYFSGTVVVINWMNNTGSDLFGKVPVAGVISSVLKNNMYAKRDTITHICSLLVIILLGIISLKLRTLWQFYSSIILFFGIFLFSIWMFFSNKILFDPLYPLFTVFLSATVFSLLKLSHETPRQ